MSIPSYNRIYNLTLSIVVLYNVVCIADMILACFDISNIIMYSAAFYLIFAIVSLICKIQLARKYFLSCAIPNIVAHLVLTIVSVVLIIISIV